MTDVNEVQIQIKLYGSFKSYSKEGTLSLSVPQDAKMDEIKKILGLQLAKLRPQSQAEALVTRSVLADDSRILKASDSLENRKFLAILPPVSGG
jgi:hypothetical protein